MKAFQFMNSAGLYIEIGQSSLKAVDGNDGLELSLERLENGRLSPPCAERLASSLKVFLKKHSWRPGLRAFCAIGARGVSLRRLTLPASSKDELQRLLLLQIEREFPLAPDELAWGYRPISSERNGSPASQELLVVAVKKEVLQEYSDLLSGCGLSPVFTLGALARSALCPQSSGSFAVLDIGRKHSELISFDEGAATSIRILPWGGEDITHALEKNLAINHAEAEKLKTQAGDEPAANGEFSRRVQTIVETELSSLAKAILSNWSGKRLYLSGGSARLKDLAPRLSKTLGGGVECARIEMVPGEGSSAAILGLKKYCENEGSVPPLILHLKSSDDAENVARPVPWKWVALAALLVAGSISLRYAEAVVQKSRLVKKISEIRDYRAKLPKVDRELGFFQYLKTNQPPYLEPIFLMANAAPPGAKIESLSLNRRGDLSLRASMKDSQQVVDFRAKLISSGYFSGVVVDEQAPSPDRQKLVVRMTGQWKPTSERKPTASELSRPEPEKPKAPAKETKIAVAESAGTSAPVTISTPAPRKDPKD